MNNYLHELTQMDQILRQFIFPFAWKVLGAFAVWIASGFIIKLLERILVASLQKRKVDPTLINYAKQTSKFTLKALLVLVILSIFGIETTSFSAILAAAGVAIGVAWSGLLSNFAAGIFLILLRPFRVGDTITAAGTTGTVREIGLFSTTIDNGENLRVFVGNNKIFSDNILNYSLNPHRVASFKVQLAPSVEPKGAIDLFLSKLSQLSNLAPQTKAGGEISEFNTLGTLITLRVSCHQSVYPSVLAQGNQIIFDTLKEARYPTPESRTVLITSPNQN